MKYMGIPQRWMTLTPAALALSCAMVALHADAARVHVDWINPADFSDLRQSMCVTDSKPDEWLGDLATYVQHRAEKWMAAGQHLQVTFTDVMRAGVCEPWHGPRWDEVRIVKDIYPPRMDLHYVLTNADGTIVRKGDAKLRDLSFLHRGTPTSNDPLRYEKRMLNDWLRGEFNR